MGLILDPNGKPYEQESRPEWLPSDVREPPPWIPGRFRTVEECDKAAEQALWGWFQYPTWLIKQTLKVPRVRGPFQTRLNGLTGTDIQWLPGRDNELGRRAARDIVEDWPKIASAATRYQLSQWGLTLGVGFAKKHWYHDDPTSRWIPRLEVYNPEWSVWDWALNDRRGAYRIWTLDGWEVVPSPAQTVPGETFVNAGPYPATNSKRWVVHEPFGPKTWIFGLIHAIWASALGWTFSDEDMSALSERQGLGGFKVKYPKTTEAKAADGTIDLKNSSLGLLMNRLRRLGRKFVIPVEQYKEREGLANYDVEPFEWSGVGFDIVKGTKESKALDLGVLILGHNTTVSSTTAGASAGANVGNLIRGDLRIGDCLNEGITARQQVLTDWAEVNYGDPGVAPVPFYITDAPMANLPAAQTLFTLAQAVQLYRAQGVPDDVIIKVLSLFQLDVKELGPPAAPPTQKKPPAAPAQESAA